MATTTFDVSGKNAVITGGGSGICLAFAELLLSKGCSVLVGDLALTPKAEELAKQYSHPHPPPTSTTTTQPQDGDSSSSSSKTRASFVFHKTDVTSWKQLSSLWQTALSVFDGRVDLVVPGAGVYEPPFSSFWLPPGVQGSPSTDAADADLGAYATISINLVHPIRLAQLAIGHWSTTKTAGNLLFVSSIAGHIAAIGTPLYYTSKAGVHNFVRSIGGLRQKLGIRVMAIAPGIARTPLWEAEHTKDQLPESEHVLSAELVAKTMLDLCEDAAQYGDGEIVEYCEVGTAAEPKQSTRQVPSTLLYPDSAIAGHAGVLRQEDKIWKMLETEGLNV